MIKRAEPPPPKGVSVKEWDKRLNRKEKQGFYGSLYPNKGEKISGYSDVEDFESGDPTRMMPRLRQIHKLGERQDCFFEAARLAAKDSTLKLMVGRHSKQHKEDTRHFWLEDKKGRITDPTAHQYPKGQYLGGKPVSLQRNVDFVTSHPHFGRLPKAEQRKIEKRGYKLQGHTNFQGLPIAIENRRGSVRTGKSREGVEWRTKMRMPYGYIVGTEGKDGEGVDCYVGPDKEAPAAFVVHQHKPDGTGYDEDKVMLGFPSKKAAKEAFLMHYDSPKFLGPMAKVSMDRLRELVASKKQLVKISSVQGRALLEELMAIEKTAFNLGDARRVLRLAKKKTLKVPRVRQAGKRLQGAIQSGATEAPPGMSLSEVMLAGGGGGAPMAVSRGAHRQIQSMARSGAIASSAATPQVLASTERLGGKILTAKGGDATTAIRRHPLVSEAVSGPIGRMTPQQRIMHNATVMRHEMAEQAIKPKPAPTAFGLATGHRGPEAPLTDSTILATLPKGSEAVKETVKAYRPIESHLLERATRGVGGRPGMEFGSQRLSRHARKRVAGRMEELATGDIQKALADPETGPLIRAQLKAQGVGALQGVGKLASAVGAPESVRKRERGRLVRKAGPGVGGLLGAGVGALVGARRGKLLRGAITGLGTGATLGWTPDMYHSAKQAIKRYRRKVK